MLEPNPILQTLRERGDCKHCTNSRNFARGLQTLRACMVCIHACVARIETHTYVFFFCCTVAVARAGSARRHLRLELDLQGVTFVGDSATRVANRHPARVAKKLKLGDFDRAFSNSQALEFLGSRTPSEYSARYRSAAADN